MGSIFKSSIVAILLGLLAASGAMASKPGDVNGDNSVDTADLTTLVHLLSSGKTPVGVAFRADVNRDGVIDTQDLAALVGIVSGDRGLGECEEGMWDCCYYLPPWGCCGSEV